MVQHKKLINLLTEENDKILHISSLDFVNGDWNTLFQFLEYDGFPKWSYEGSINPITFGGIQNVTSLYNLTIIEGNIDLKDCKNLKSLGPLKYVGGYFDLEGTSVTSLNKLEYVGNLLGLDNSEVSSFGNLKFVGSNMFLDKSPLMLKYTKEQIRQKIEVVGRIIPFEPIR